VVAEEADSNEEAESTSAEDIEALQNSYACYLYGDYYFYDVNGLRSDADYTTTLADGSMTYTYNFCQYINKPCGLEDNSANDTNVYATGVSTTDATTCSFLGTDETTI
jgi:hypothetical protein